MNQKAGDQVCPGCGASFVCGVAAGESSCWCMALPVSLPVPASEARCYCSVCLKRLGEAGAPAAPGA